MNGGEAREKPVVHDTPEEQSDRGPLMSREDFLKRWLPGAAVVGGAALVTAAALEKEGGKQLSDTGKPPTVQEIVAASRGLIKFDGESLVIRQVSTVTGGVFMKRFERGPKHSLKVEAGNIGILFRYTSYVLHAGREERIEEQVIVARDMLDPKKYAVYMGEVHRTPSHGAKESPVPQRRKPSR